MALLTPREREVLALISCGLRCRGIATTLGIATFTVRKHRSNVLGKLGLHSTAQLVAYAISLDREIAPDCDSDMWGLTAREVEIIRLATGGKTTKQIARLLELSPSTVSKHRQNAMRRHGCKSLATLIASMNFPRHANAHTHSELLPAATCISRLTVPFDGMT